MKKEECKPLKKNIPEVQKTQEEDYKRDEYQRRPFTFRQQRIFNIDESTKEKIVINWGMNLEGLHHREDHLLLSIKIPLMVTVFIVLTLEVK